MADATEQDDDNNVHDQARPNRRAKAGGNTFSYPSESDLVGIIKENQRLRRQEWIIEKIRSSRVFWFFSSQVEEPRFIIQSRSTLDRGRYERFRCLVSWTHIGRLQSSYAVKLGLTGLVIAPLLATLFLYIPELKAIGFPKQFGFLFLSGLCFVLSSVLFRLRCPVLLLETLSQIAQNHDSFRRKDLLEALVSTEFANLVTWRRYPVDLAMLAPDRRKDELAVAMAANGWNPALAGYGPREFAMIERAIYEFANRRTIKVWAKKFNREIKQMELTLGGGPRITYEGSRPYIVRLYITKPDVSILEQKPEVNKDDLVIDWHETNLDDLSHLPKTTDINVSISYAEGLHHLFASDDAAEIFAVLISRWQDHRRGVSRLIMFILYTASVALFASFLWLQTEIVMQALNWI